MKLDKSNFSIALMVNSEINYEGTINVTYIDKIFKKDVQINDSASITEENHPLTDSEKNTCNQINKIILKEFNKKGYKLDKWNLYYSVGHGDINIGYVFGKDSYNDINLSLLENNMISKKCLSLSRSLSRRLLKELK